MTKQIAKLTRLDQPVWDCIWILQSEHKHVEQYLTVYTIDLMRPSYDIHLNE